MFLTDLSEWQEYAKRTWFRQRIKTQKDPRIDLAERMEREVLGAAILGQLTIFGRLPHAIEFEPIHKDTWKLAHFAFAVDPHTAIQVKATPWSEDDRPRLSLLLNYEQLEVEIDQFTRLWPKAKEPLRQRFKQWWKNVTR
jgi:hypothetical protein